VQGREYNIPRHKNGPAGVTAPRDPAHRGENQTVDESKSSAERRDVHPETRSGDPFVAAARSKRVAVIAHDMASAECERCGAVADLRTDDGVPLCEGCAL
jgi:hypothetical protein